MRAVWFLFIGWWLSGLGIDRLDRVGQDALRLFRWYRSRAPDADDDKPSAAGWRRPFTVREASRSLRAFDADRVRRAVLRLEEHGYVRLDRTRPGPGGGRPSDVVTINPADERDG